MKGDRLETVPFPLHVLIIGGRLGGLCLAQGLKKSGISVAVYERDSSAQFRNQGYRISIKKEGSHALRDCLKEDLFRLLVFLDQQLHVKFAKPLPHSLIPDESGFGVNRLTLREILLAGMEDMVHFGKTCERFDQMEDGLVSASFTDGTAATGDLLVGADGTHSVIRALIAPDAMIDTLHYAIYGKTPIRSDTLDWMPEILVDSFNQIVGPQGTGMSVATCRQVESAAEAITKFAPGIHLTDIPGYFSWTLSLNEEWRDADGSALHQHACNLVKEWHPALRWLIDEADIPATFPIPITSARPVNAWHIPNVTLLGDAIHTMSPGRGEGANVALRDAQLLCHVLGEVATNGASVAQAKAQYEREMLRYGFEAVSAALNKPYFSSAGQESP
jgi:2-polyprenyl-6-methoxyphenol hydroxylase-like FAD-dependent oxidoreductase